MRLDEVNEYEREALRQLMQCYPSSIQREITDVNLRTMRILERDALVQLRWFYDNEDWPPRPTRESDRTWEVRLTAKGVNLALMLGYEPHAESSCPVPAVCELHTPFLENRIKLPTLEERE